MDVILCGHLRLCLMQHGGHPRSAFMNRRICIKHSKHIKAEPYYPLKKYCLIDYKVLLFLNEGLENNTLG